MTKKDAIGYLEWMRRDADLKKEFNDALLVAISALQEQKWIPCSERLPEENGFYLVTVNAQNRPVRIYEYAPWEMSEEREYWINDCDDHSHVFNHFVEAWMPLSEPYREEGD